VPSGLQTTKLCGTQSSRVSTQSSARPSACPEGRGIKLGLGHSSGSQSRRNLRRKRICNTDSFLDLPPPIISWATPQHTRTQTRVTTSLAQLLLLLLPLLLLRLHSAATPPAQASNSPSGKYSYPFLLPHPHPALPAGPQKTAPTIASQY